MMKKNILNLFFLMFFMCGLTLAQETTIVAPTSEAAEGLDLHAVSELFKEAENLEEFEKSLNDPETGINNIDLDENGEVDYIRVVEDVSDQTHIIILQVVLAEDEFQDVATIEVEQSGEDSYNLQVHGNEVIYGESYYLAPTHVYIHTWPIIGWMYRPYYRPYRSSYYFGFYPRWWRPYRPVTFNVYHQRTVRYTSRSTFTVRRTSTVKTVHKVNYQPKSSTLVKKKTTVTRTNSKTAGVKKVSRSNKTGQKTTTVKAGVKKTTNPRTGKKTVKGGVKKTTKTQGRKRTVKGRMKKTTPPKGNKTRTVKKGAKKTSVRKKR